VNGWGSAPPTGLSYIPPAGPESMTKPPRKPHRANMDDNHRPACCHLKRPAQLRATPPGRDACHRTRMLQHTRGALPGLSGSLRRHLYRQAERLTALVHDPDASWTGLSWR